MVSRGNKCGFTLIELVVVAVVIALVVSILMPALGSARAQARGIRCLAQCRELGQGMGHYHHEWGNFPAHQWRLPDGSRLRWFNAMECYLGGYDVPSCPSLPDWEVCRNNAYGYNYKYLGSTRDNALPGNRYRPYETFPVREVRCPSRTIAFADCDGTGRKLPWGPEKPALGADHDPRRLGNHGYTLDPTYIPVRSLGTYSGGALEPYAWHEHRTFMSDRHRGKASTVFADGHGEHVAPRDAYEDNGMWNGLGFDPASDPNSPFYAADEHVPYRVHPCSGQEWRYWISTGGRSRYGNRRRAVRRSSSRG
jgi:prepilin-type N-terminal cleavage/methylation domain-containing protein/prepilin-type processing-associated H-X9-DG protein